MQGRFLAEVIEDDRYFLALNRYIHLNPVKAGIVHNPRDYQWSSYNAYIKGISPSPVDTAKTLGYFSEPKLKKFELFTVGGRNTDTPNVLDLPLSLQLDDGAEEESPDGDQTSVVGEDK